jgi:peptidoglycan L-alanyl-D-glutamate endopeptidase CwlK
MPSFGSRSQRRLEELHEDLQLILLTAIKHVDFSILEGHRDKDTQNEYFHAGKSKLKWPLSKHNKKPSEAADVLPYPFAQADWSNYKRFYYLGGILIATAEMLYAEGLIEHKLRFGGDWDMDDDLDDQKFNDLPHVELVEV